MAQDERMKQTLVSDPHLNPLLDGEAEAQRPVRVASRIVWRIVDVIVGGVFIYAGVIKALDSNRFAVDIDNYKILPWFIGVRLAFYLPWLEILCGLALIARKLYLGGLSILSALVAIFIIASIVAKVRGIDITCGCFGHASKYLSFGGHLALDFVLLSFVLLLLRSAHTQSDTLRSIDV